MPIVNTPEGGAPRRGPRARDMKKPDESLERQLSRLQYQLDELGAALRMAERYGDYCAIGDLRDAIEEGKARFKVLDEERRRRGY